MKIQLEIPSEKVRRKIRQNFNEPVRIRGISLEIPTDLFFVRIFRHNKANF